LDAVCFSLDAVCFSLEDSALARYATVTVAILALLMHWPEACAQKRSALQYYQQPPLPPQMVDLSLYDDVIELNCQEQKKYLTFSGSQLTPVSKVKVSYRLDTKHDKLAPLVQYEDLWYHNSVPIGCKKSEAFAIKKRDQVAILVKNDRLNNAEIGGIAGALVALRLELSINRNLMAVVRIPNEVLDPLIDELRKQNFLPYRELGRPLSTLVPIQLETDLGKRETMCFQKPQS
jgi:hypothetical protein